MRKILVCQHVPFEILGTLDPLFRQGGFRVRYANFGRFPHLQPSLTGYQGLVILGGPMSVDEVDQHPHLATEVTLIKEAIEKKIPVLGICLGAQLIAKALGARVYRNREKEIGWYDVDMTEAAADDPLFSNFRRREKVFQWHGDTFDMPAGAVQLGRSEGCEHQAFRYGANVYGLQFHLEVDQKLIERWLTVPSNVMELEKLKGKINPDEIRQLIPEFLPRMHALSLQTFGSFIDLLGPIRKFHRLPLR